MRTTPLEQAAGAWADIQNTSDEVPRRQIQMDAAAELGAWDGFFSNANIALITGLNPDTVAKVTGKTTKTGGRLAPASLPLLLDLRLAYIRQKRVDRSEVLAIVNLGTSPAMISKLTGIGRTRLYSIARQEMP